MNRTALIIGAVVIGIVVIAAFTGIGQYNSLVQRSEAVDASWAQVENVLQRRADLIPNLVETVRGYAGHEREIFTEVADARSRLLAAGSPNEAAQASGALDSALGRLLAISEQYPQLRASEQFTRLQDELAGTENRIAVERRRYNEEVRGYNSTIRTFPTNLYAGAFGFDARDYFEIEPSAREVPRVDFSAR